jgi:hypothetical protein
VWSIFCRVLHEAGLDRHRQPYLPLPAPGRRQLAHVGDDGCEVGVDEAVVFLARHDDHRPAVRLDAVADRPHPVGFAVARDDAAGGDVGRADEHRPILDDDPAAAVRAVAVAAAARAEQVGAALDARGVAPVCDRRDGDVDAALELAIAHLGERDERRARSGDEHRQRDRAAADPLVHVVLALCGFDRSRRGRAEDRCRSRRRA